MEGKIDSSFTTTQRDFFISGMAAEIGMNAYGVWQAIKVHSDYQTGKSWPGMRRLAELTGLSKNTVNSAVRILIAAKLLRTAKRGRGLEYIARERMVIRLGSRILCTVCIDYVPATMRQTIGRLQQALAAGESDPEAFAECEIIPGPGFAWDNKAGVLRAKIHAKDIPPPPTLEDGQIQSDLVQKVLAIKKKAVDKS